MIKLIIYSICQLQDVADEEQELEEVEMVDMTLKSSCLLIQLELHFDS